MRTRTFFLSLVVHALMVGAAIVAPLFATDELPDPPARTTFVVVAPEVPHVPPPVAPQTAPRTPRVKPNAAPITEPPQILPERIVEALDPLPGDGVIAGAADLPGLVIAPVAIAPPPSPPPAPSPVRIGGAIRPPQKVHHVAPDYPAIARSARVSGIVILEAMISEDGSVREVKVLRSIPLLDNAAADAVRQWRFTPTLLNGVPVPVVMTVTVAFNLN
jgi:protein TonB